MINLLRRAWDTLDTFKQAYPENWHEEDQAVLDDLMKADTALQHGAGFMDSKLNPMKPAQDTVPMEVVLEMRDYIRELEEKLKERNK